MKNQIVAMCVWLIFIAGLAPSLAADNTKSLNVNHLETAVPNYPKPGISLFSMQLPGEQLKSARIFESGDKAAVSRSYKPFNSPLTPRSIAIQSLQIESNHLFAGVERSESKGAYSRWLIPVALIVAGGVATYVLYSLRSS